MDMESPIFVTGMPRSGTTLFQEFLSKHPRILIHGQEPVDFRWGDWLQTVVRGAAFSLESNTAIESSEPHYAGAVEPEWAAGLFLNFVRDFLCGVRESLRWGLKSLTQCRIAADSILQKWPGARWIVCVRHPFRSIESLRNTFDPGKNHSLDVLRGWWTDAVEFGRLRPQAKLVLIDRLSSMEDRRRMVSEVFGFLGETPTESIWRFVEEWPVIHKVVPDDKRTYILPDQERQDLLKANPQFADLAEDLGYLDKE